MRCDDRHTPTTRTNCMSVWDPGTVLEIQPMWLFCMCFNAQMGLKLEIFVSAILDMTTHTDVCMDILRCSYLGAGCQLLLAQRSGHYIIQMLCAKSLGIKVCIVYLLPSIPIFIHKKKAGNP